jgi:hypothetical protein
MSKARDLANAGTALTTVSATELGYLDGVTSAVQTQLNAKQATVSGVNDTEIGYLDGVTSAIQTQINAQIPKSTITAKGDLLVGTGSGTLVAQGVGANGTVLTANSAQADGVEWTTPASGSITLLSTTSLSSTSTTVSSISGDYTNLIVQVIGAARATSAAALNMRVNGISGANTYRSLSSNNLNSTWDSPAATTEFNLLATQAAPGNNNIAQVTFPDYARAGTSKSWQGFCMQSTSDAGSIMFGSCPSVTSAITSITIFASGTFTAGTIRIYGVK